VHSARAAQHLGDGRPQAPVGVGDAERHAGQAARAKGSLQEQFCFRSKGATTLGFRDASAIDARESALTNYFKRTIASTAAAET